MWARLCRPDAVQARDRLAIIHCDVLDAAAAVAAMNGGDAVICTVGPANNRKPGTLISVGTRNLVAGCTASGITRFVFESGLMVGDGRDLSMSGRFAVRLAGWVYSGLKSDKVLAVADITAGPLDWVIVRPPNLIRAAATGLCIAGPSARISPRKAIPHADCAAVLLNAASKSQWIRQVVNVGRL